MKHIDLTGHRFGDWRVIERAPPRSDTRTRHAIWVCRCKCGTISVVYGQNLRSGKSTSCWACFQARRTCWNDRIGSCERAGTVTGSVG